ncbi:extracellular solute-binding protein [Phytoactinopolyspora limicola]|uniref:extracellular solute-binding protein n=1 Tax=Phytoactinopolyspora limicola TaxID=2715536 RepID=UPI001A9C58C7|nr:extracellular solute-binding protein [Phytoactinopolyspora limicola]
MRLFKPVIRARFAGVVAGGLAVAVALTACGGDDGSSSDAESTTDDDTTTVSNVDEWVAPEGLSGSITLYSANPQGLTDELIDAFEAKTDVTVDKYADVSGRITARLDAEWDNPQADLVYLASWGPVARYAGEGQVRPYVPATASEVNDGWSDPDGRFTGRDGSALGLVVNTELADGEPTDWADLAGPEWEGLVTMPDPRESGTARDLIAAMITDWGEEDTWALFDDLFANGLHVEGANGPALDRVLAGSYAAVLGGVDYSGYAALDAGESVAVVLPESGTTVTPRPVFIMESSENADAAEAFVDFMFSAEGQAISVGHYMIPARPDVPVGGGMVAFDDVAQLNFTWDEVGAAGADVLAEFVERYL